MLTITTDVFCDVCGDWEPAAQQVGNSADGATARVIAQRHGWHRGRPQPGHSGRDICPDCWLEGYR